MVNLIQARPTLTQTQTTRGISGTQLSTLSQSISQEWKLSGISWKETETTIQLNNEIELNTRKSWEGKQTTKNLFDSSILRISWFGLKFPTICWDFYCACYG